MLMALELSGGGTGAGLSSGKQAGTDESSLLPLLGGSAAPPAPADGEALSTTPPAAEAKDPARKLPPAPAQVPAVQKPAPTPTKQTPITHRPPKQVPPEQTLAKQPDPGKKTQNPQQLDADIATAELPEEPAVDSPGSHAGDPESAALPAGAGNRAQGTDQGSRSGASGAGANIGESGADGNMRGRSGAGGSLVTFGAPGGPGVVRMARPRYPHEARRLGKEGVVVLKLSLDETGAVRDVEVLQGVGFGLEEASREAVLLSRFRPATLKGRPVACQVILPIHFKLR
ncbi:TonB family protein [Desulfomicrobium baculatum DSM 4028]|uniref:TonB family protein n=2 Tax=Desulfomicrobium baculatum TaxID=899 RepID=C7LW98_DESBD|nr:TonB family protein [Desulfomicrobium baculatum DSM 4028]